MHSSRNETVAVDALLRCYAQILRDLRTGNISKPSDDAKSAQQPLVHSNDGQLLFLPRMLLFLDLPRMYVGALNKIREGRAVYDRRINEIETAGVKSVACEIRAAIPSSLQIVANVTFRLADGCQITPDIVVVSRQDRTVLVIDLKYSTPPFGPADIHRRVEECEKWKERMGEYLTSIQDNPEVLGQHLHWAHQGHATVFGLILTRWPLPVPVDFTEPVGAVDWPSLKDHILETHPSSIRELGDGFRQPLDREPSRVIFRSGLGHSTG